MMTALLVGVAVYTILGGMLSVLVTDFLQFVVMSARIDSRDDSDPDECWLGKTRHYGGNTLRRRWLQSFVNPTMGWQYVLFNLMLNTAAVLTWQTIIARVLAAKDTGTGRKVYTRNELLLCLPFLDSRESGGSRHWPRLGQSQTHSKQCRVISALRCLPG
jgi:SSS family solute:Na+ symporter